MNKIFYLTALATLIYSCNKSENKKDLTEEQKQTELYENADLELESHKEKIALLSITKNIPTDSLYIILKEYYAETGYLEIENQANYDYAKIINAISTKVKMPKNKVANLIYDFKYEMITKENIEDQLIEESESESYNEPPEYEY